MKIDCSCGHVIHDHSDNMAHKTHCVPDRRWTDLLDGLDALIKKAAGDAGTAEAAAIKARALVTGLSRRMGQCSQCGALYVEDRACRPVRFLPGDKTRARDIFEA